MSEPNVSIAPQDAMQCAHISRSYTEE